LRWSAGRDPITRHPMIFKVIFDITRSIELIMGVLKSVYCMIISTKDYYSNVNSACPSTFER
jgi:hypothetical protein